MTIAFSNKIEKSDRENRLDNVLFDSSLFQIHISSVSGDNIFYFDTCIYCTQKTSFVFWLKIAASKTWQIDWRRVKIKL